MDYSLCVINSQVAIISVLLIAR